MEWLDKQDTTLCSLSLPFPLGPLQPRALIVEDASNAFENETTVSIQTTHFV